MISVLMSIYNEKIEWVKDSINSIISQTYSNFEFIIIVDNPNITTDILKYLNEIALIDKRIRLVFNNINIGLAKSMNIGLELANGEFIARMDADDISEQTRFQEELDYLCTHNVDMVSTNRINIDETGRIISYGDTSTEDPNLVLPYTSLIVHPSVLVKTSIMRLLNGYRDFPQSQDYDLWLRMITSGYKIAIINKYLIRYRVRTNSLTNINRLEQFLINEYQKKLYYERIRTGMDTFSEVGLKKYLSRRKIDKAKNRRCLYVLEKLELSRVYLNKKSVLFIFPILNALFVYPLIVMYVIRNKIRKYCNHNIKH